MKNIKDIKIGIIGSNFHKHITDELEKHCIETLARSGLNYSQILTLRVPGSLEIPLVAKKLAKQKRFDAIIVIGVIHKGKTYHFEQIANECIRGCMDVSWRYEIPVIYEVLAVYDIKDALKRAIRKKENLGEQAALFALSMIKMLETVMEGT